MFTYLKIKAAARKLGIKDKGKMGYAYDKESDDSIRYKCALCRETYRTFVRGNLIGYWCYRCITILEIFKRTEHINQDDKDFFKQHGRTLKS